MKTTDLIGFAFVIVILRICYFIVRRITFHKRWLKILASIFIPLIILVLSVIITNILKTPLYALGIAVVCCLGLSVEMFIFCNCIKD